MTTDREVKDAADEYSFGWGYTNILTINDVDYVVEWVEVTDSEESTMPVQAVFKITLDGKDRYFVKHGFNESHVGTTWDGSFYETVPTKKEVTVYQPYVPPVYTVEEVILAIDEDDLSWWEIGDDCESLTLRGELVRLESVDFEGGGGEWYGEGPIWVVFKVGDQLFKKTGYYASYGESSWDGKLEEVVEKEKTIKVYERK